MNGARVDAVQRGLAVGLICAVAGQVLLGRARSRYGRAVLGPADRVTWLRAVLTCAVAGLTAASFEDKGRVPALVVLAAIALTLDLVDGKVARRTGTASDFGAAFDMEVDAFLVLVLSVEASRTVGPWVLLIGAARYVLLVAGWLRPWLRRPVPVRYWAKVVAAVQGIVLLVATAQVLPGWLTDLALVVALGLLVESFGHQVWWLLRHRTPALSRAVLPQRVAR
jgi:phosphatidylglycerophosphate synthase